MNLIERSRLRRSLPPPTVRRVIREESGLSQADIAEELGVDRASISRWESGEREPRGQLLERYAALLQDLRGNL